jgi:hypothetical protein
VWNRELITPFKRREPPADWEILYIARRVRESIPHAGARYWAGLFNGQVFHGFGSFVVFWIFLSNLIFLVVSGFEFFVQI